MPRDVSVNDFGLVIAYLMPGFTVVWGTAVALGWLDWRTLLAGTPSLGGIVFTSLVSLAAGLTVSTLRWLVIDPLHHATGVPRPERSFRSFDRTVEAYQVLGEIHYRYYQNAAGMFLATAWVYGVWRWAAPPRPFGLPDMAALGLVALYFAASRDALWKYYRRTGELMGGRRADRGKQAGRVSRA